MTSKHVRVLGKEQENEKNLTAQGGGLGGAVREGKQLLSVSTQNPAALGAGNTSQPLLQLPWLASPRLSIPSALSLGKRCA